MNDSYEGISIQDLDMMASEPSQMMASQYMQQPMQQPMQPQYMQQPQQMRHMQPTQPTQPMQPQYPTPPEQYREPERYTNQQMKDFAEHLSSELDDSPESDNEVAETKNGSASKSKRRKKSKRKNGGLLKKVPEKLRVPLVVFLWFVILSQKVVKEKISQFIPQIKPMTGAGVGLSGIIIYGILFSALVGVTLTLNDKCFG